MVKVKLKAEYYSAMTVRRMLAEGESHVSSYSWADSFYDISVIKEFENFWRVRINKLVSPWGELLDESFPSVKKARQAIIEALNQDCGEDRYS